MTATVNDPTHVTLTLADDASIKFFNNENGRKLVVEIAKMKDTDGKPLIPATYTRGEWEVMKPNQKEKVLKVWREMPDDKKQVILNAVNTILATKAAVAQQGIHNTNTNKNDKIRIIHIYVDPRNSVVFSRASQSFQTRQQLDDDENREDNYAILTERFNDRQTYHYQNIGYVLDPATGFATSTPCPIYSSVEQLYQDLNPDETPRPPRDVGWFKTQFGNLKAEFTKLYARYTASGQQDAEDPYLEFSKFCAGNEVMMYMFMLLYGNLSLIDRLGKLLPDEAQSEGSVGLTAPPRNSNGSKTNRKRSGVNAGATPDPDGNHAHGGKRITICIEKPQTETQVAEVAAGYVRRKEQADFALDIIKAQLQGDQGQNLTERAYSLLSKQMAEMESLQASSSSSSGSHARVPQLSYQTPSTTTRSANENSFDSDQEEDDAEYVDRHTTLT